MFVGEASIVKVKRAMVCMDYFTTGLQILRNVSTVRLGGFRKKTAPSANLAKLEVSTPTKVIILTRACLVSLARTARVKRAMVRVELQKKLQILRNVSTVQLGGFRKTAGPSANLAKLEVSTTMKLLTGAVRVR